MAPPTNYLKANEEEWREIFNRLSERFPTVSGDKVAKALRDHHGHAGEAASVLRDLTSSVVKQADPDDVEHVATLLSSPAMFKHACKEQFRKFDVNKDGVLEWDEVKTLTTQLYDEFGLPVPSEGSLKAFFYATDENQDGVLSEREFRKFFEMFLRYAFFDHLKLRQMVEKGQAIEAERAANGGEGPPATKVKEEASADADTSTPNDSRASSASTGSKPPEAPAAKEPEAPPAKAPKSMLAPIDQPKEAKAAGRRSPPAGQEDKRDRHDERRQRRAQDKERERAPPQEAAVDGPFGPAIRCLAANGVAYRASPAFQDRMDQTVSKGQTVQVLEHWVRTPDGWLPVLDPQGQSLFERSSGSGDTQEQSQEQSRKRVSIREEISSRTAASADDTLDANVRKSRDESPKVAAPSPKATEGGGGSNAKGLQPNEEEWRPVFERLSERFPHISQDKIVQALRDNEGHAGKAASMLRYM